MLRTWTSESGVVGWHVKMDAALAPIARLCQHTLSEPVPNVLTMLTITTKNIRLTRTRWSNWTVVGFSKIFLHHQSDPSAFLAYAVEKSSSVGGAMRPPMNGNSLYISPASKPATKAPGKCIKTYHAMKQVEGTPDKAVKKTREVNVHDRLVNRLT